MSMKPLLYQNDHAGAISYVVYIGGMEIPTQGYDVSYGVWEIPQATVRLVPDPILYRLGAEDRLPVQCFYLDQWQNESPEYCLIFDGEIVSWGRQSVAGGRVLTFTCVDYMAILTQTFFFLMSTFDDFAVGTSSAGIGVAGGTVQTPGFGALYPYSLFAQGVANSSDITDDRIIERPIDYAYNIVRSLIKLTHPNRSVPAANFFTPWAQRTNFHRRWVATPYFDADPQDPHAPGLFPVLKAVQDSTAIEAIARQAAQSANGSLWSMLQEVLRTVMCELTMLPTPAAVKSDYRSLLPKGKPVDPSEGVSPVFLTQYFVKPQSYYSLPPVCNVFFPSQIQQSAYQENYATQPTRAYYNEATISNILSNSAGNTGPGAAAGATLMQDALTTGYPEEVDIAVRDARDAALQNGKNMLVYPEEYFKGPVVLRKQLPRWFAFMIDATRSRLAQSGTSNDGDPTPGAEGLNNVSQYSQTEGGPVYFGSPTNPRGSFLSNLGITEFTFAAVSGQFTRCNPSQQRIILTKSLAVRQPGECVPPQVFPLRPTTAWNGFTGRGPAGMFWSVRGSETIHGGHDLVAPMRTEVVAPVAGTIVEIVSATAADCAGGRRGIQTPNAGVTANGRPRVSASEGNCVIIRDEKRGLHRLMHMYSIEPSLREGQYVPAGTLIGAVGATGEGVTVGGAHLHYDVVDSTLKFRMPYPRRLAALGRHPGATAELPVPPPEAPPSAEQTHGTAPQSDQANANLNPPNTSADGGTGSVGTDVAAGDTTRNLFKLYAKCDYYTERYAARNGTLSMPFNPYPIPGFGCAVFDRRDTELDTVGYLTNVQHSVSAHGWGTTITYSQGRTFQEMFMLMQRDAALDAARAGRDSADVTAIVEVRYSASEARIKALIAAHPESTRAVQESKWASFIEPGIPWVPAVTQVDAAAPDAPQIAAPTGAASDVTVSNVDVRLGGYAAPVGDVRMAPAEPIEEIRQLQDVEIADAFYRAMFWQLELEDQQSSAGIAAYDVIESDSERSQRGGASFLTQQGNVEARENPSRDVLEQSIAAADQASATATRTQQRGRQQTSRTRLDASTVFRQEDVIRMVTGQDVVIDIEHSGTSSMTRTQALQLIRKASYAPGDMTDEDISRLSSLGAGVSGFEGMTYEELRPCFPRRTDPNGNTLVNGAPWAYVPCPTDQMKLLQFLRGQETRWRTQSATTNVRGDVSLIPTPAAQDLFASYTAAMRYNARPVCTLDEYLLFLGDDALSVTDPDALETVRPQASNFGHNDYTHPAKYYRVIREYRQGPPRARARTLLTGRATGEDEILPGDTYNPLNPPQYVTPQTEPVSGMTGTASADALTEAATFPAARTNPDNAVQALATAYGSQFYDALTQGTGIPSSSAKLRVDAILMSYLTDSDVRLQGASPPITQVEASAVAGRLREMLLAQRGTTRQGAVFSALGIAPETIEPLIPRDIAAPFLASLLRPQTFSGPLDDSRGQNAQVTARVRTYLAEQQESNRVIDEQRVRAARSVVGSHTIQAQYIAGVPGSFPETRADWYAVLEQYRRNVLSRMAPSG